MSLLEELKNVEESLAPNVRDFLYKLASEVETHKSLLNDLGALGGPVGETAAQTVEEGAALFESGQGVTPAPTVPSTSGEGKVDMGMDPTLAPLSAKVEESVEPNVQAVTTGSEQGHTHSEDREVDLEGATPDQYPNLS